MNHGTVVVVVVTVVSVLKRSKGSMNKATPFDFFLGQKKASVEFSWDWPLKVLINYAHNFETN